MLIGGSMRMGHQPRSLQAGNLFTEGVCCLLAAHLQLRGTQCEVVNVLKHLAHLRLATQAAAPSAVPVRCKQVMQLLEWRLMHLHKQ